MDPFHDYYDIPWWVILGLWSFIAIGLHVYQVGFIVKLIRLGKDDDRFDSWKKRMKEFLTDWLGQRKVVEDKLAGYAHALIFWGFLMLVSDVIDLGTDSRSSVDYPDYGKLIGEEIKSKKIDLGIAICGSGIGISIAANKIKGVRAALCNNIEMAKLARNHNDANVLALGARLISTEDAINCIKVFLLEKFEGGRHINRVKKIG